MIRFRLFGIPVEIQPFFWIVLVLLGPYSQAAEAKGLLYLALFVIAGTISILVHELGHALAGRAYGARTSITLHAFGGFASFPNARFTRKQDFLVTAAGPAIQIVLGLAALALLYSGKLPTEASSRFIGSLAGVSLYWAILNLLPIIPLDGGRLVLAVLGPRRQKISLWISLVTAVIVACVMLRFGGSFFALFLAGFAYENWRALDEIKRRGY
ncbi:MAG: site-2 protease family protein [Luteolibacter sp.]